MKGIKLNPNQEHVDLIIKGLQKKDGFCPCKTGTLPENKCPCDELIQTGHCHCQFYIKEE